MQRWIDWAAGLAVLVFAVVGAASSLDLDPSLTSKGWQHFTFSGKDVNGFRAEDETTIRIESRRAVSLISRDLDVDLAKTPILAWQWRVDRGVPATDLGRRGEDDRSIGVYIAFAHDPERDSLLGRMRRGAAELITGKTSPGWVLMYFWGGEVGSERWRISPYLGTHGRYTVARPAATPLGLWFDERIDVAADFAAAFGFAPTKPMYISVTADSDDTGGEILAFVRNLGFRAR
jgi:hypothetical protein